MVKGRKVFVTIYCDAIKSKHDFYSSLDGITPEYFGKNLDALHDVLTEISGTVRFVDYEKLRENLGSFADGVARVLDDSKRENHEFDVELDVGGYTSAE